MQTALLMEQEVGPACSAHWTVGRGGRLSVCPSVFQLLPPGPEGREAFQSLHPGCLGCGGQYISNKHSGGVSWCGSDCWSCPIGICGASLGGAGPPPPTSRWHLCQAGSIPAFLAGSGTRARAFSKLIVEKRMCKALGLFEGPTDPPQRWPIHSRLPGNNNQEK